jgi:NADPH:quinone reductase-like Zn-dependent oxidoreductase
VTVKAIRVRERAGISGLVYEEVPDARPGLDDVLVKVVACGITHNELDCPVWTCRAGHPRTVIIPGQEVSGVVDQGHLRPQVGAVYPLAQAARAFTAKAAGGIPGRVILQP